MIELIHAIFTLLLLWGSFSQTKLRLLLKLVITWIIILLLLFVVFVIYIEVNAKSNDNPSIKEALEFIKKIYLFNGSLYYYSIITIIIFTFNFLFKDPNTRAYAITSYSIITALLLMTYRWDINYFKNTWFIIVYFAIFFLISICISYITNQIAAKSKKELVVLDRVI